MNVSSLDYSSYMSPQVTTSGAREVKTELGKNDFLQLLVTQMRFQDPMKPLEGKEFLSQLAQFSALEQMMNVGLSASLTYGLGMLGKTVYGENADGEIVSGTALSVKVNDSKPTVHLKLEDGKTVQVELGKVFQVDGNGP